jgi:hypothetical protein
MNTLTESQVNWIAGLLEGEGCFLSTKSGYARISCAMTDEDVILRLQSLCEGKICRQKAVKEHWKPIFIWYLNGDKAVELARVIKSFMFSRRKSRIENMIDLHLEHSEAVAKRADEKTIPGKLAGAAYKNGEGTLRQLAKRFHVSQVTVLNHYRKLS